MSTTSPRWGFTLPDPADTVDITKLNNDLLTVDNALGATPCTSATRPSTPTSGQIIREHDTGLVYIWDSTSNAWAVVSGGSGGSGILPSTVTAAGDLIVGAANAVVSRFAAGSNGQVLTVDSTQALGVKWANPTGGGSAGTVFAAGNSGTALTLNLANGPAQTVTMTGNCTFTLSGATNGIVSSLELILTQDGTGSRTVTWPASVKWSGAAPTLSTTAAAVDRLILTSYNGGTTWYGDTVGTGYA